MAGAFKNVLEDKMLDLDDDVFVECGLCADALPQYFEIADGEVRIRPRSGEGLAGSQAAKAGSPLPQ
jgi:hypothetical protein